MKYFALLFLFSINTQGKSIAQEDPIVWGQIPIADLQMTSYDVDPEASAVVLADYGAIIMELEGSEVLYRFQRHCRIKVFDAAKFNGAMVSVPYYSNVQSPEHLSYVKAQMFTPNGGKIGIKGKNFVNNINEESWSNRSFTFPEIKNGAVLEYRYEIISSRISALKDWYFQENIPVRFSEVSLEMPNWFRYDYLFQGTGDLQYSEDEEKSIDIRINTITKVRTKRYRMENIPAMKIEPFTSNINDNRSRLRFQLKEIRFPNGTRRSYMTTWQDLTEKLLKNEQFGLQINDELNHNSLFNSETNAIIKSTASTKDKANQLYQYLNKTVRWNDQYNIYSPINLNESFLLKKANSGELNLMLIVLLRKAGIDANPLLVTTRSKGKVVRFFPIDNQFNHILVHAILNDTDILMDVSNELRPINLPRADAINEMGWLVAKENARWVDIEVPFSSETYYADLTLGEDGSLKGKIKGDIKGLSALECRTKHQKATDGNLFNPKWMAQFPQMKKDAFAIHNVDNTMKPFQVSMNCHIPNASTKSGAYLLFKPMLFSTITENPFTDMERLYSIEFPCPMKEKYIMNLNIPDGYRVEKLPKSLHLILPNEAAQFHYLIKQKDNTIQLVSRVTLKETNYPAAQYLRIKNFFEEVVKKQNEEIVLVKKDGK